MHYRFLFFKGSFILKFNYSFYPQVIFAVFVFTALSSISLNSYASGFISWEQQTPNKTTIYFDGNSIKKSIYLECSNTNTRINYVNNWFFFRDSIIGTLNHNSDRYFVFNEVDCSMKFFKNNKDFDDYQKKNNLAPFIWTRWYNAEWGFFNLNKFGMLIVIIIPLLLVVAIISLYFFYKIIKKAIVIENFSIRKPNTIFILLTSITIITRVLLDIFPQSI